jgi:hypothetical protein
MSSVFTRKQESATEQRPRFYVRINKSTNVYKIVSREEMLATLRAALAPGKVGQSLADMAWGKTIELDGFWWRVIHREES